MGPVIFSWRYDMHCAVLHGCHYYPANRAHTYNQAAKLRFADTLGYLAAIVTIIRVSVFQ